jgi:acetyltransferase
VGDPSSDRQYPETSEHRILAVARLSKLHGTNEAEFAPIVSDSYHPRGLGTELLRRLLQIGQEEKLQAIVGYILTSNYKMYSLCKKLGFEVQPDRGEGMLKAVFVC